MTIVGILGCTMLIVFGFGIRDTVDGLMSDQFGTVTVYDAIVVTNKLDAAEMRALSEEWSVFAKETQQIQLSSMTLQSGNNNTDITVIVVPDDANFETYVHLRDVHTKQEMALPNDRIVLTQNAAKGSVWRKVISYPCKTAITYTSTSRFLCVLKLHRQLYLYEGKPLSGALRGLRRERVPAEPDG